jgi:hypothetical protein
MVEKIEYLCGIDAPDTVKPDGTVQKGFYGGLVLRDERVSEAADVIKYMRGWSRDRVREYCRQRRWRAFVISWTCWNEEGNANAVRSTMGTTESPPAAAAPD